MDIVFLTDNKKEVSYLRYIYGTKVIVNPEYLLFSLFSPNKDLSYPDIILHRKSLLNFNEKNFLPALNQM